MHTNIWVTDKAFYLTLLILIYSPSTLVISYMWALLALSCLLTMLDDFLLAECIQIQCLFCLLPLCRHNVSSGAPYISHNLTCPTYLCTCKNIFLASCLIKTLKGLKVTKGSGVS